MKRTLFYALAGMLTFASCNNDDDAIVPPQGETPTQEEEGASATVYFKEIQYQGKDLISIYNPTNETIDLSDYWLCLGPGTYEKLGDITPESGAVVLPSQTNLVVSYALPDTEGGLGLYSTNTFANPEAIVDFVQYGAAGSARENVAVEAGIWTEGDFVPTVTTAENSITYDGAGDASSDWSETTPSFEKVMTTFSITITNTINYLASHIFNTPTGASSPGPASAVNDSYTRTFKAVPGAKLSFATMSVATNDWFFAPKMVGIELFDANGTPITGDISSQIYLWDAGTEEEDPATITTVMGGATAGAPDDDNRVRVVSDDVTADIRTELSYDSTNKEFTLTLTNLKGASNGIVLSPGLVILHAQNAPLFTVGQPDRGLGLEAIAEAGQPQELWDWFTATGSQGTPLRLSSSISVLSPAVVYAFGTDSDPWFTQGEAARASSGVEEIAEDGNNQVAYEYLKQMGIPVAKSDQTAPVQPGESLTFTIQVPKGQDYKLGFGTMLVQTNDWFVAYNNAGLSLFDAEGNAFSGTSRSNKTYLYDSGTEVDETVGFGINQAPRQSGPNVGAADANTTIRRVSSIDDVQFGKGIINSAPGVTWSGDPRGGYNILEIDVQPMGTTTVSGSSSKSQAYTGQ